MSKPLKPSVVFFMRKPRAYGNYSFEFIFDEVRRLLAEQIDATVWNAPYTSDGIIRRIQIAIDAMSHQAQVNHITGDINYVASLLKRRRTVLTIHDCSFLNNPKGIRRAILKLFWLIIPVMRSQLITTVSEVSKREIQRHCRCNPNKIHVIPNPISDHYVHVPKVFNRQCPQILQVGTAKNKNIGRLADALRGIRCHLHIVGKLDDETNECLVANGIEYTNHVNLPLEDLVSLYGQSDIVTFASTYEGFGMPIVEANAVGRPVITSDCSSMPEVAQDAACLVDPFDVESIRAGIVRVIEDEAFRNRLIENGLANARRFDADVIAQQYLDVYRKVAGIGNSEIKQEQESQKSNRTKAA